MTVALRSLASRLVRVFFSCRATSLSSLCLPLVYLASVAFAQVIHAGAAVLAVSVDKVDAVAVNGQATVAQVRYQRGAIRTTGHAVQFLAADWPAQHDGKCPQVPGVVGSDELRAVRGARFWFAGGVGRGHFKLPPAGGAGQPPATQGGH